MGIALGFASLSLCATLLGGGKAPSREAIRHEIERLACDSEEERAAAFETLASMGAAAAMPVANALRTAPETVRPWMARLLGGYRDPKTIPPISLALDREKSLNNRRQMIRALGKIGKLPAAQALREHLAEETEIAGQRDCLLALADSESPSALDTLLSFAEQTEEEYLRETALKAMKQLTKRDLGKDLTVWRSWWKKHREDTLKRAGELAEPAESEEDAAERES